MMSLEQIAQKEKSHVVHHHRNSNHSVVAWIPRFEHKPKFPENRRMDPHSGCSCRHTHHSKSVRDHLASHKEQHSRNEVSVINRSLAGGFMTLIVVVITFAFSLSVDLTPARAGTILAADLCGQGSAPDYGFTYDLQQIHWTVDWQSHVSENTVTEVDVILDQLNSDSIAQTMILIQSEEQVGNRVNCAVHFLRYMRLGLPDGERKDNGFVFLIVVESNSIDVHYGVGLGLPALTASELTSLNRIAEDTYQTTKSLDQALLTLIQEFDKVARSNYSPLISPTPTQETISLPTLPSGPLGILSICGLLCIGVLFLLFLIWMLPKLARSGINFNPYGSGSRGSGFPLGGGRSSSRSRGGSGSGRSGRGN